MASGAVERAPSAWLSWTVPWFLAGCGGGAALLHPAQTLPVGSMTIGAGVSGHFGSGEINSTINDGRSAAEQPITTPEAANAYAKGVLTNALVAPGASPWVSARVGILQNTEAGLTYTGRSLRLDGRYAFELDEEWTLSLGLGASGTLLTPERRPTQFELPEGAPSNPEAEFEPSAKGWGADLPVLLGVRLLAGFADVWFGPRLGFEHLTGNLRLERNNPASTLIDAEGTRLWAGLVAGFSLGIPPLSLRFELTSTYQRLSGTLTPAGTTSGLDFDALEASGWTFAPSGAIVGKF
jgi:hypothetical protein